MIRGSLLFVGLFLTGCVNPTDVPDSAPNPTPTPVPITVPAADEMKALQQFHKSAVEQFASLPAFGGERMIVLNPLEDVITPPHQEAQIVPNSTITHRPGRLEQDQHRSFQNLIGHPASTTTDGTWKLTEVQLVGLSVQATPVVYVTDHVPGMKEKMPLPTRVLSDFEQRSLAALQRGEHLVVERRGAKTQMMGPIFAGRKCLACHETKGQLLGAFTYVLEQAPVGSVVVP